MTRQSSCSYSRRFAVLALFFVSLAGVASAQTLSVDNSTLNITAPAGGFAIGKVNLSTTASTTVVVNTTNSPGWLSVNPTGPLNALQGTPTTFTVIANASGLANGSMQSGTFTIGIQSSNATPLTITVNLTVGPGSIITANPPSLSFTVPLGTTSSNIPTQPVAISSSGAALNFDVSATTTDQANWLVPFTTTGNTTNAPNINVGVNPGNLPAGVYHGTVYVLSKTTADSVPIPVTMTVTQPATLTVTPTVLQTMLYQTGTVAQPGQLTRTVMVSSNITTAGFTATLNPPASWLVVNPPNGATGSNGSAVPVTLTAIPGNMAAGVYTSGLVITPVGGAPLPAITVTVATFE
jgi:hypothetical protein